MSWFKSAVARDREAASPQGRANAGWAKYSASMVALTDKAGRCLDVSEPLLSKLQSQRASLLGTPLVDSFMPSEQQSIKDALAAASKGTAQCCQCTILGSDASAQTLKLSILPLFVEGGHVAGCEISATDVSQVVQELDHIKRSEQRLRTIMDQIPVTISYIDANYCYRYINRAQAAWLGKTEADVVGRRVNDLVRDEVWADIQPNLQTALSGWTFLSSESAPTATATPCGIPGVTCLTSMSKARWWAPTLCSLT